MKVMMLLFLISSLLLHLIQGQGFGTRVEDIQRLVSGEAGDRFGYDLAITETTLVVGAPSHDGGFVYVYVKEDNEWVLQDVISAPTDTGISFTRFGQKVAVAGDTVAVHVYDADLLVDLQYLFVFGRSGSDWTYTQVIENVDVRFVLTEAMLATLWDGELQIYQHISAGQIDTTTNRLDQPDDLPIDSDWGSRMIGKGSYLFLIANRDIFYVFKENMEGRYIVAQKLTADEELFLFSVPRYMSVHGSTLAVFGWEGKFGGPFGDIRIYSFETGTLELQASVPASNGIERFLKEILLASEGLLLQWGTDDYSESTFRNAYWIDSETFGSQPDFFLAGVAPFTTTSTFVANDDIIAISAIDDASSNGIVQIFDTRTIPYPTLAPTPAPSEDATPVLSIRKFLLFNTNTDRRVSPSLEDGDVYDRKEIGRSLNIKAVTDGSVDSVVFELDGYEYSTDEDFPYMLRDGDPQDHRRVPELAGGGTFTVTATPYTGPGGTGTAGSSTTVTFTLT